MTPPEPAAIKPEAKKVNVAAKSGKAAAAQTRIVRSLAMSHVGLDRAAGHDRGPTGRSPHLKVGAT